MIIVKLQGGLGNQMFQYAAARSLGNHVKFDLGFLSEHAADTEFFTARKFELGIFKKLHAEKAGGLAVKIFKSNTLLYKTLRRIIKPVCLLQQGTEPVDLTLKSTSRHVYLDGYFQNDEYFKNIRQQLLNEFAFSLLDDKNKKIKEKIEQSTCSVSLHIRRGDYLKSHLVRFNGVLPLEYYRKSLQMIETANKNLSVFIFSDDIDWVKEHLKYDTAEMVFVAGNTGENSWKDMALMAACKHHITANSSFSWWGAWLSTQQGKTFAPVEWFNPLYVQFDIHHFVPANWTIVDYN